MSEANNTWRVEIGGQEHDVEIDHSALTGRIEVRVDGAPVLTDRLLFSKTRMDIMVAGLPARVSVDFAYVGFSARSEFHLNGRYLEPLRR